ncbi:CUE domain-containing protein [Aphelenchoides besseyi]|nr:CUE domain-containing protein [Aphelenchoides besseyi]KAI6207651.1 CUE domain-containing protein [Aphelenchoides besseyi]
MSTAELTHEQRVQRANELRSRVMIGRLTDDFLRSPMTSVTAAKLNPMIQGQVPLDPATQFYAFVPPNTRGRLVVRVVEARLAKNYGLMRMDPYLRMRIGSAVFETHTSVNGGKTPTWNRIINAYLPNGVESVYVQVFDERSFTNDEVVAWAHIILPQGIFVGETIDEWFPLSGALGDKQEGAINLVFSFTPVNQSTAQSTTDTATVAQPATTQRPVQRTFQVDEAAVAEVSEMFPNIEVEVIKSVMESTQNDKNAAVTALIEMNES